MIELKPIGFEITTCVFSSNFEVRVTRQLYLAYMQKMKGFHFEKSLNQNVLLWPHFGWPLSASLQSWAEQTISFVRFLQCVRFNFCI